MILTQEIRVLGSSMGGTWKAAIAEVEPDCEVDRPWDEAVMCSRHSDSRFSHKTTFRPTLPTDPQERVDCCRHFWDYFAIVNLMSDVDL